MTGTARTKPSPAAAPPRPDCSIGPCQGTANTVLDLLGNLLSEQARQNDGQLPIDKIMAVIDTFKTGPGELTEFYDRKFEGCHSGKSESSGRSSEAEAFDEAILSLAGAQGATLTLSKVQAVGLADIKAEAGERWPRVSEQVHSIARATIRKQLSPDDCFMQDSHGDYLICFASLDTKAAWAKAQEIAGEISRLILGKTPGPSNPQNDLDAAQRARLSDVAATVNTVEAPPADQLAETDILGLFARRFERASKQVKDLTNETLRHMASDGEVCPRPVKTANGKPANLAMYCCDEKTQKKIAKLLARAGPDPLVQAELDQATLLLAADHALNNSTGKEQLLVLGVHCSTLRNERSAERYMEACAALDRKARSNLVLSLIGCDDTMPTAEVEAYLKQLRGVSSARAVFLDRGRGVESHLPKIKLHLVVLDYGQLGVAGKARSRVSAISKCAKGAAVRLLVDGIPPKTPVIPLAASGATFFCFG